MKVGVGEGYIFREAENAAFLADGEEDWLQARYWPKAVLVRICWWEEWEWEVDSEL